MYGVSVTYVSAIVAGVLALFATVVVFGPGTERREPAVRVVGAAAIAGWSLWYWTSSSSLVPR